MKKTILCFLAVLPILISAACGPRPSAETVHTEPEPPTQSETEIVTYYCTVGSYTQVLMDQIRVWNETVGTEQGVEIQVATRCNCALTLEDHLKQGDAWDLLDGGGEISLLANGWIKDLETLENPNIQSLLDSYRPCIVPGTAALSAMTMGVPKEAVPLKLAVNLDLFEKNGLELPATWDDVVAAAKTITENGSGLEFGWGGCIWSGYFQKLILQGTMNSVQTGFWDPNTEQYRFSQYEPVIRALTQMYADGSMLGFDTMSLDEIRSQFSAGRVGMLPALGYDFAVYTLQFPAQCNYTFIDMPVFDRNNVYPSVCLTSIGPSICAPLYDNGSDAHRTAVEEAWLFLNSDELNRTLYQNGCIIPCKQELMDNAPLLLTENTEQWKAISDLTNCTVSFAVPDSVLTVEGESYDAVFSSIIRGERDWTADLISDLEARYNAAYQKMTEHASIKHSLYSYSYSHEREREELP